jgi:hypothetical protein
MAADRPTTGRVAAAPSLGFEIEAEGKIYLETESLIQAPSFTSAFEDGLHSAAPGIDVLDAASLSSSASSWLPLYASHFLSAWGQRGWEFACGLLMLRLAPSSLLLVSVFGLVDSGLLVILGPAMGAFVDSTPRLRAACLAYAVQGVAVAASAAVILVLLAAKELRQGPVFLALVALAMAAGALGSAGASAATLSVEREWTRALCGGNSAALARINAGMKRIDLTCLIASPIVVGALMEWGGGGAAAAAVAGWNVAAWAPECWLLAVAQRRSAALRWASHPFFISNSFFILYPFFYSISCVLQPPLIEACSAFSCDEKKWSHNQQDNLLACAERRLCLVLRPSQEPLPHPTKLAPSAAPLLQAPPTFVSLPPPPLWPLPLSTSQ